MGNTLWDKFDIVKICFRNAQDAACSADNKSGTWGTALSEVDILRGWVLELRRNIRARERKELRGRCEAVGHNGQSTSEGPVGSFLKTYQDGSGRCTNCGKQWPSGSLARKK